MQIEINRIGMDDLPRLQEISRRTFVETFAAENSPENMRRYLDEQLSLAQLGAELATEGSRFYFASLDSTVIGYLKLNTGLAQTDPLRIDVSVLVGRAPCEAASRSECRTTPSCRG